MSELHTTDELNCYVASETDSPKAMWERSRPLASPRRRYSSVAIILYAGECALRQEDMNADSKAESAMLKTIR
eukprot:scaffold481188_cov43-Prasinocladus_malaysianus.AAC.1